mmetsp:Transcript_41972/g.115810  ORF Transcript_41972/g.115810 Transcript_41972/m.115810 type:complete len:205 (+) Transcript_41972:217-831(+)
MPLPPQASDPPCPPARRRAAVPRRWVRWAAQQSHCFLRKPAPPLARPPWSRSFSGRHSAGSPALGSSSPRAAAAAASGVLHELAVRPPSAPSAPTQARELEPEPELQPEPARAPAREPELERRRPPPAVEDPSRQRFGAPAAAPPLSASSQDPNAPRRSAPAAALAASQEPLARAAAARPGESLPRPPWQAEGLEPERELAPAP